ncbi:omega-hydroxyceramide transacylase-like isoform X2 [Ascaphus truei]|uniref:omega-hydroxyceramide transacylase-like isoform X2 n=1 Tax=Ascaphus truei TaxID=8439 RepID=UPI003F59CDD2
MTEDVESENSPMSLSFSGSGFLALYQIGAVQALWELAPDILKSAPKVYGASAGSLIAAAVVCRTNLDELQKTFFEAAMEARKTMHGLLFPCFNATRILHKALLKLLPDNAHQLTTGRLHVALTRLSDGKNILVSDYKSKEEVMQRYIDGGLTNFQPLFDLKSMITVSPFTGEIDICPRDCPVSHLCLQICNTSFQLSVENLCRVSYSLFPPSSMILNEFVCQGYKDAILYLNTNTVTYIPVRLMTGTVKSI